MSHELFNIRQPRTAWFDKALAEDGFETWFEPIVDTSGHKLAGHECRIRYRSDDPDGHVHKGAEILEAARTRNDIAAFDSYARALAVRSAALQRHLSGIRKPFFVNFLPASIHAPEVAMRSVMKVLPHTGLEPADIVFEAVEADLVDDSARLCRIQEYMEYHGFGFALDNVGIGANPLQGVSDLRPDYIKIDKNVVLHVEQPMYAATVRRLAAMSEEMGVKVIATGVNRKRTMENLWLLGINVMQGHLFGRSLPGVVRDAEAVAPEGQLPDEDLLRLAQALGSRQPELLVP